MKNATPLQLAAIAAAWVAGFIFLLTIVIKLIIPASWSWWAVFFIPILVFLAGTLVFFYFIESFIYRKIKVIYKTIYDTKVNQEEKPNKQKIRKDIIDFAESEVIEWKEKTAKEQKRQKKLEKYRKEFLGNVFHELKTPIFNIQGYLETLNEGGLKDDTINTKFLQKAITNVSRMAEIVDDLQMISNLEEGSFSLVEDKFDILKLANDTIDSLDIRVQSKNIKLCIKEGCDKSFMVSADRDMIQQVLTNLITNSIKYGKENGRTQIGLYDMNENILVEVSDNGLGIDPKHLPRIFERFYRVDKDRSREQGGSGLGLSIVKHVIEAHNQTVNVRSAPGVGSTFGFTLKKIKNL
jgi:two-component system phosphate regulon sensor histidine kinase PhoR